MMKVFILFFMIIAIAGFGVTLWRLYFQERDSDQELRSLYNVIAPLERENKKILEDIRYYKNQDSLVKELREQYHYTYPGEKLIIVVPNNQ